MTFAIKALLTNLINEGSQKQVGRGIILCLEIFKNALVFLAVVLKYERNGLGTAEARLPLLTEVLMVLKRD